MENMELYNGFREVPQNAQRTIDGGRLKGMTDINPMWRIQTLTERFGPCGIGWKYIIRDKRLERGPDTEVAAFVDIDLYYKIEDCWSEPVPGTGGASFVMKEKSGPRVSDECFKMALTDALSVACKALGIGADVYWAAGRTKYTGLEPTEPPQPLQPPPEILCHDCGKRVNGIIKNGKVQRTAEQVVSYTVEKYGVPLCWKCSTARKKALDGQPD